MVWSGWPLPTWRPATSGEGGGRCKRRSKSGRESAHVSRAFCLPLLCSDVCWLIMRHCSLFPALPFSPPLNKTTREHIRALLRPPPAGWKPPPFRHHDTAAAATAAATTWVFCATGVCFMYLWIHTPKKRACMHAWNSRKRASTNTPSRYQHRHTHTHTHILHSPTGFPSSSASSSSSSSPLFSRRELGWLLDRLGLIHTGPSLPVSKRVCACMWVWVSKWL